jgi:subtilisin family serine protease
VRFTIGVAVIAFILALSAVSFAQYLQNDVQYSPNRIVIAIKPQLAPVNPVIQGQAAVTGLADIDNLNQQFSATLMQPLFPGAEKLGQPAMAGYYSVTFQSSVNLENVLDAYAQLGSIEHVEPVGIHRISYNPNDPQLSLQWAITKIEARQAWDVSRGSATVPLAIADTGVDWDHPDLNGHIWQNTADPVDGSDNDGNGLVDDYHGWDWVNGESGPSGEDVNTPDNNPMDFNGHGTHCSGIASAETNNSTGIAGVGFDCKVMALRIGWQALDGNGYVGMDYAAQALYYAANKGAKAFNASWGSSNSGGIAAAATYAVNQGVVIVSAAGNDNNNTASYLCGRTDVIAVAATDDTDHRASFSNYGSWVDVSAPGVNIRSTYFDNTYTYLDGTSMAAPHVVGLVGLIRAIAPSMTRSQVQSRIISTTDDIDALNPSYAGQLGSGRINAFNAVNGLGVPISIPIPISPINSVWTNNQHPTIIWSDTSQATRFYLQLDDYAGFTTPLVNDSTITDTSYYVSSGLADGIWYWRAKAGNAAFWTDFTNTQTFRIDTQIPGSPILTLPANESWTNDATPTFSWQAVTDPGGSGIDKYLIQIETDSLFSPPVLFDDSTSALTYNIYVNLPQGRIFWRVLARDRAGNIGSYANGVFNIDSSAPLAPISMSITPDNWVNNPSFVCNWTNPAEGSGITTALYKIGSAPTSNYDTTGHFPGIPPAGFSCSVNGVSVLYLWLVDGLGNVSYLARSGDTLKFDNIAPRGCLASSPDTSGSLTFTVNWSEGFDDHSGLLGIYDVRYRDGIAGPWIDWYVNTPLLTATFSGQNAHTYYFEARNYDNAGNADSLYGVSETSTVVDTTFAGPSFIAGDVNGSGDVNGLDVIYLVNFLKGGNPPPDPILRADANGTCSVNGIDAVYLVNFFKGGSAPYSGNCLR